mgnify:CR=1 FL=1
MNKNDVLYINIHTKKIKTYQEWVDLIDFDILADSNFYIDDKKDYNKPEDIVNYDIEEGDLIEVDEDGNEIR